MADDTFVECTQFGQRTEWKAHLRWSAEACANFSIHASGPGLRYLKQGLDRWLVIGEPRPEQPPAAAEGEPDPAHALILAFSSRGQSALRHTEGSWALLYWNAREGELILAVDRLARCPVYFRRGAAGMQVASHPRLLDAPDTQAAQDGEASPAIERVQPGSHLRFASDGVRHIGFHGSWRETRADRRPWPLILGEFEERLKSVLRLLAETADLAILAEQPASSALLAAVVRHLPGRQPSLLWVQGWSQGDRAFWSEVSDQCGLRFIDASVLLGLTADAVDATVPPGATGMASTALHGGAAALSGTASRLTGGALLASAAQRLCPADQSGSRPMRLLSGAGFDLLVPGGASLWRRLISWTPWVEQDERRASQMGNALTGAFATHWQEPLESALENSALRAAWPMLDETVALFLVNLPPRLREGGSWRGDFRSSVLRSTLPARVRRALAERSR